VKPQINVKPATPKDTLPLRARHREEMNSQIVHDSIHGRPGWTESYLLELDGETIGFGTIAIGGPWKDKPTLFEFYLLPEKRSHASNVFEALLSVSRARFFEVQTNEVLVTMMALAYGRDLATEKIIFHDRIATDCASQGAILRCLTPDEEIQAAIEARQGGGKWVLELNGTLAAEGGILFHYNRPYGDIYMQVKESFRGRGLGAYLVQELKRACYQLGAVPAARCNPENTASLRTLQRAGFAPCAAILIGSFPA
jgi:GNAT superfamily N-acetyltransferase